MATAVTTTPAAPAVDPVLAGLQARFAEAAKLKADNATLQSELQQLKDYLRQVGNQMLQVAGQVK